MERVAVGILRRDQVTDQRHEAADLCPQRGGVDVGAEREAKVDDAEALDAVEQRHPQPRLVLGVALHGLGGAERPPGQRGVHVLVRQFGFAADRERGEDALAVVDEVEARGPTEHGRCRRDCGRERVRSGELGTVQQRCELLELCQLRGVLHHDSVENVSGE